MVWATPCSLVYVREACGRIHVCSVAEGTKYVSETPGAELHVVSRNTLIAKDSFSLCAFVYACKIFLGFQSV